MLTIEEVLKPKKLVQEVKSYEKVIQETYDYKISKIKYSLNRVDIVKLEEKYISYFFNKQLTLDDLLSSNEVLTVLREVVGGYYNKNKRSSRLTYEDLFSVAYEKVWKTITSYNYQSNYWLYHHLKRNIKHSCLDVLRSEGLTKDRKNNTNEFFHKSSSLQTFEEIDSFNLEDSVILRDSLKQTVLALSKEEYQIYKLFLNADNVEQVTLNDICCELNLKHRQQAKRLLDSIRTKLNEVVSL